MLATSAGGKSLILRIADAGEVIGLPGTISGKPYEATAEAQEPIQANFIPRKPFLEFLRTHGEVALRVAEALSDIYYATYREVRCLGLSGSVEEKLASFLLDFAARHPSGNGAADIGAACGPTRAVLTLTHEEIADTIGSSRETVTRLFADFKRKGLVQVQGSSLVIDKPGLQGLLES
jgi:CRP/FNR family transcriptional regulator